MLHIELLIIPLPLSCFVVNTINQYLLEHYIDRLVNFLSYTGELPDDVLYKLQEFGIQEFGCVVNAIISSFR